ncbi:beta-glucosidase [Hypoxylon texense]
MGFIGGKKEAELAVGSAFAAALPQNPKPWYRSRNIIRLNLALMVPLLSSASVGYDGSMMNGLQTLPQWKQFFGNPEGAILGMMNAVYPLGKVVALFLVTYISDRYGRKLPIFVGLVCCVAFAIMQALSQNLPTFVIARALLGFFTSFISQPSPVLITELAYPTQRGKVTAIYLISRGRHEEARKFFTNYHADGDEDSALVKFEMDEIEHAITQEAELLSKVSWFDLVRTPANRKRTFIALILGWFSQWNGVGVVSYYLTLVLNTIGITDVKDQTLINGLLQIFNWLVATFCGALMVDRLGRRTLFLLSTAGMLGSYIAWTGLTSAFVAHGGTDMGRAVVAFIFIYYFFYDIAWTPLLQAYPVEIYPYTLRGRGLSFTLITSFVGLIVGNQVNPIAMKAIGWKYYIVFCCLLACLLVLVWFFFPETKGHTLEEIREVFEGKLDVDMNGKLAHVETGHKDEDKKHEHGTKEIELA